MRTLSSKALDYERRDAVSTPASRGGDPDWSASVLACKPRRRRNVATETVALQSSPFASTPRGLPARGRRSAPGTDLIRKGRLLFAAIVVSGLALVVTAQPQIIIEHNTGAAATAKFKFKNVPSPARDDAAAKARLMIVDAEPDSNSADLSALTDGLLPDSEDQPRKNFFLVAGSGGGRLRMDLNSVIEVAQVNSFSWHSNSRAPQVYRLWASDGTSRNFNAEPKANVDPAACGWRLIATVDTRSKEPDGGQYGVSITGAGGSVGRFRYLLFDLYVTEVADNFGNTFYSEIDVVAK